MSVRLTFFTQKRGASLVFSLTYKKTYVGHLTYVFKFKMTFKHQKIIIPKLLSWILLFHLENVLESTK